MAESVTEAEVKKCIALLEKLLHEPEQFAALPREAQLELLTSAGRLSRPLKSESVQRRRALRKVELEKKRQEDRAARSSTGIRAAREDAVFTAPKQLTAAEMAKTEDPTRILKKARNCYVCKAEFTRLHFFYDQLCENCADFNYQKRFQVARLDGQVALITGARLKIGYQAALLMLRSGARVIVTTRFPVDASVRFSREPDFADWKERLQVYGLDLRHTPSVELFTRYIEQNYSRLDILINNAAQTVRRPPAFYAHLMAAERLPLAAQSLAVQSLLASHLELTQRIDSYAQSHKPVATLTPGVVGPGNALTAMALPLVQTASGVGVGLTKSAELSQLPYAFEATGSAEEVFPEGKLDADLQQVDLRETNSWRYKLQDVPTPELLEVQLVNSIAPFVLCSRLAPLMRREKTGQKHIVNVTAMEGKFYRFIKPDRHPHTNMAKAALNMLVHTSASDLAKDGIFMNAVDTGWVTDEDPAQIVSAKQAAHDFQPPLDIVDGAARICDPFFHGILSGQHWCGKFLKDYFPIDW